MSKNKLIGLAMDLAAVADDLDRALADVLAAADGDARSDLADDGMLQEAHQLIGQVPLMHSPVDKDSFAIRAHRKLEQAMRSDFRRIAGDAVRRRIMPEHDRIRRVKEQIGEQLRTMGG